MFRISLFWLVIASATSLLGQTRLIPHLTRPDGGFTTTLQLENTSAVPQEYTLSPYDEAGNALDSYTATLAAGAVALLNAAETLGADASHLTISNEEVRISASYDFAAGDL